MTLAEIFQAAFKRVKNPETWCQEHIALDRDGQSLETANDPHAVKWCSLGALFKTSCFAPNWTSIEDPWTKLAGIACHGSTTPTPTPR